MFDPITLLAGIAPLFMEAGKAAINRWLTPDQVKPANVEEYAKLKETDLKMYEAIANADSGGETYQWVEAIRKLQRPFVTVVVLSAWAYCHATGQAGAEVDNMASVIGFYLFGERTMFYIGKAGSGR